jgi:hypothetical protein
MPQNPIPCTECARREANGIIKVRNSGKLLYDKRSGLLVRECLVTCSICGDGKMLMTLDMAFYSSDKALPIEPTPLSAAS